MRTVRKCIPISSERLPEVAVHPLKKPEIFRYRTTLHLGKLLARRFNLPEITLASCDITCREYPDGRNFLNCTFEPSSGTRFIVTYTFPTLKDYLDMCDYVMNDAHSISNIYQYLQRVGTCFHEEYYERKIVEYTVYENTIPVGTGNDFINFSNNEHEMMHVLITLTESKNKFYCYIVAQPEDKDFTSRFHRFQLPNRETWQFVKDRLEKLQTTAKPPTFKQLFDFLSSCNDELQVAALPLIQYMQSTRFLN